MCQTCVNKCIFMDIDNFINENTNLGVAHVGVTYSRERLKILLEKYDAYKSNKKDIIKFSYKDIDSFYNDTMYTDQTNHYGVTQKTKKGDYVIWKQPSQMIKDFISWKNKQK